MMNRETLYSLRFAHWAGAALIVAALLLYLLTLDNGFRPGELEGGDLITHQYAQVQARPGNAPGYPLYTMGGWLWFHFWRSAAVWLGDSLPNPIPLLSSYSTLFAVTAVGLLYSILLITLPLASQKGNALRLVNWPLAWLMAAFYAVTYFFWYYAVTTEQYSSAVAQTLLIFLLYLLWRRHAAAPEPLPPVRNVRFNTADLLLIALAFFCGISLAHMLTVAFIVPPLIVAILWEQPALLRRGWLIVAVIVAAFSPLASYLYVYLRGAAHPEWRGQGEWTDTWSWFWSFVSTAQGREELAWGFEAGRAFWGNGFPELIWQELSIPLLVLGLIGAAFLGRKPAFVLYGTFGIYALFCWMYRYGNWFQVILPVYPLILVGAASALHRIQWSHWGERSRLLQLAPLALLFMAVIWRFNASWPEANSRNRAVDTALHRPALLLNGLHRSNAQQLIQNARLFASASDLHGLDYLINIWGVADGLQVTSSDEAGRWLAAGRPVLATWDAAALLRDELPSHVQPTLQTYNADWVLFTTTPLEFPPPQVELHERVGDKLTLVGYSVNPGPDAAPVAATAPSLEALLLWRLEEGKWPTGVAISVRPTERGAYLSALDGEPGAFIQYDAAEPMHGIWQAARPQPGSVVADAYRLTLPETADIDGITVLLYTKGEEGFMTVAEIHLPVMVQ